MRYKVGLETREKILEATRAILSRSGLEGTTIKAICDEAGVLPGSFYNLFDSKEQAVLAVVREAVDAVDPDPAHQGTDTLKDLVEAYVRFLEEQEDLARVYIRVALAGINDPDLNQRVLRTHAARVARFADAMTRSGARLSPEMAERRAETLVTALNGIALHRALDSGFDAAWHAAVLLDDALSAD